MKRLLVVVLVFACWRCRAQADEIADLEAYIRDCAVQQVEASAKKQKPEKNIEMTKQWLKQERYDAIAATEIFTYIGMTAFMAEQADRDAKNLKDPEKFKDFLDSRRRQKRAHIAKCARYIELKYSVNEQREQPDGAATQESAPSAAP